MIDKRDVDNENSGPKAEDNFYLAEEMPKTSMFRDGFSERFEITSAKGVQDCDCKNNTCTKFCESKVHRRMLAGDQAIQNIGTLGDFGEIKDWISGSD